MKERLLDFLVCPICKRPFSLSNVTKDSNEIEEGILSSECGSSYPILNGIPRLLPSSIIQDPDSQKREAAFRHDEITRFKLNFEKTLRSFGFQWTMFRKIDEGDEREFLAKTLWLPESFEGKLTLDAGCGFGRYTYFAAKYGAEVIGLDLSAAIDSAKLNTRDMRNVHLVQGNLLNLPFPTGCFDRIYSIGVLHHTPDPMTAFKSVASTLRSGGEFSIWVYDKADVKRETINTFLRSISTRLPHAVLWKICDLAAKLSYAPQVKGLRNYVNIGNSRVGNFDWYAPEFQHHLTENQVFLWFRSNGFRKMSLISPPVRGFSSSFGAKGIKNGTTEDSMSVERMTTSFDKIVDSDS